MKKYKILYQCNAYTTEHIIKADNEQEAELKFRELKGVNPKITQIEEVHEEK